MSTTVVKELLELSSENIWSKSHWDVLPFAPPPLPAALPSADWEGGLVRAGDRTPPPASLLSSSPPLYGDAADTDADEDRLEEGKDGSGGAAFPAGAPAAAEPGREEEGEDDEEAGELLLEDDDETMGLADRPVLWLNHCGVLPSFTPAVLITVSACVDEKGDDDDDDPDPAEKGSEEKGAGVGAGADVGVAE